MSHLNLKSSIVVFVLAILPGCNSEGPSVGDGTVSSPGAASIETTETTTSQAAETTPAQAAESDPMLEAEGEIEGTESEGDFAAEATESARRVPEGERTVTIAPDRVTESNLQTGYAQLTLQNNTQDRTYMYVDDAYGCQALGNLFCTTQVTAGTHTVRLEDDYGWSDTLIVTVESGESQTVTVDYQ